MNKYATANKNVNATKVNREHFEKLLSSFNYHLLSSQMEVQEGNVDFFCSFSLTIAYSLPKTFDELALSMNLIY